MLAGEPPFAGRSVHAIVARRLEPIRRPARRPSGRMFRPRWTRRFGKPWRRSRAERFDTVAQFAQALSASAASTTSTRRRPRRWPPPARGAASATPSARGSADRRGRDSSSPASALFACQRHHAANPRPDSGTRVVAVLPFDNLGDSADAYFADGVADEIRTKLAQVAGLEVIARGSSLEYRRTTRRAPPRSPASSGADYLLTGTVRWEKAARSEPGARDPRAGGRARRARRRAPAGRSSSTPRSPTSSRCRPTSRPRWPTRWASRWPTAPGAS